MNIIEKHVNILFRNRSKSSIGKIVQAGYFHLKTGSEENVVRRHKCYSFVYLVEGSGYYDDEFGQSCKLKTGDLFFTFPNIGYKYGPKPGDHWKEVFVLFDGPVFDLWFNKGILTKDKAFFHLEPIPFWEKKIRETVEWARFPNQPKALAQACRLQQLMADILSNESLAVKHKMDGDKWAHAAAKILEEEKTMQVDWEEIARRSFVSYETYRKRFTKHIGISPSRYHIKKVMEHACRLILTGQNNQEVAEALGFCDEFHFSRRFKQVVGCNTREFRKRSIAQ